MKVQSESDSERKTERREKQKINTQQPHEQSQCLKRSDSSKCIKCSLLICRINLPADIKYIKYSNNKINKKDKEKKNKTRKKETGKQGDLDDARDITAV